MARPAFGNQSESHAGAAGNTNAASFTWDHVIEAGAKGILIWTKQNAAVNIVTSVTIGGTNVPAVTGGEASDTANEVRNCKGWFLGAGLPAAGTQAVVVNRTNNGTEIYSDAYSVTASADTEVVGVPSLLQENQAPAEQNVDSGSVDAIRAAGIAYGGTSQTAGANSTLAQTMLGATHSHGSVLETTGGTGSRAVGFSMSTDDVAAVHLAIGEVAGASTQPPRSMHQFRQRAA